MKKRILSFFLICVLFVAPFISGCNMEADKNIKEKVANIFKTERIRVPDNYTASYDSVVLTANRVYVLGHQQIQNPEVENEIMQGNTVIISCGMNGENIRIDEAPYKKIEKFNILSDGSFVFLLNFFDPETFQNEYWLNQVDTSGNEVFSVNVSEVFLNMPKVIKDIYGSTRIYNLLIDGEDRIYLQGDNGILVVCADSGETMFDISVNAVNQMVQIGEKVAVQYYDEKSEFKYIDPYAQQLGDSVAVPENVPIERYTVYPSEARGTLYCYKTMTGLYAVSEKEGVAESREVVNWLNSDISPNQRGYLALLTNDQIFCSTVDYYDADIVTAFLVRIPVDEAVAKQIIKIAYVNRGASENDILNLSVKFNQYHEKYRVQFIDYTELSGGQYGEALKLFINTQIASGNVPDIFILDDSVLTGKEYEDKGMFLDLYEYLDRDDVLNRNSFLKCVLSAGETEGKLQKLIFSFRINTLVGKTENFKDMRGWSIGDFLDIAENLSDGVRIIQKETRKNVFDSVIVHGLGEFIDSEKGVCTFDSDLFMILLNYIGTLPPDSEYQYTEKDLWRELQDSTILMETARIATAFYYKAESINFGTKEITFTGFPGGGEQIKPFKAYAISAKSEKEIQDGAWEFIKSVFTSEYKVSPFEPDKFLSTYAACSRLFEQEMKRYYATSSTGRFRWSLNEFTPEDLAGETQVQITQEDIDEVLLYLESIEPMPTINDKVYEIIDQEMQYFFADAKTAEETAAIIQNRVSIYLGEQK